MNISVIIPVFNRAELVKKAVESVLAQTYPCHEIIVVDDGSNDNFDDGLFGEQTLHVGRAPRARLKLIRQKNKGVSAARNLGIKNASGDWLAFLDSDDYWLPNKLEKQIKFHQQNSDIFISQTDEIWIKNGIRINPNKDNIKVGGDIFEQSLERCMISPSAVMLHKDILDLVGMFDERLPACEDYDLWLRITGRHKVGLIPDKLVIKTGGHPDQLSKKYEAMDRFRVQSLEKLLAGDSLNNFQRETAETILNKKMKILMEGAKKRGKNWSIENLATRT